MECCKIVRSNVKLLCKNHLSRKVQRPISLLSVVTKNFEKSIHYKLEDYLKMNWLFSGINDLFQSLSEGGSYLYADDTCILYQKVQDIHQAEDVLIKKFSTLCEMLKDIKLSIYFWEDKKVLSLF